MSEYYAVERSPEYLMHYGIRGMRWGVRKALAKTGDARAKRLEKHWNKAQKKLAKLNKKADIGEQRKQQIKYAKRAGIGFGVSGLGLLGIGGSKLAKKVIKNDELNRAILSPDWTGSENSYKEQLAKHNREFQERYGNVNTAKKISGAIDLAGIGYAGYAGTRSLAAAYRQTVNGHSKAVSKRNEFQREMNRAFAGTKYSKKKRK